MYTEQILVYVCGRFALGFGNSLAQMASPLLLTEICHPQHRGPVTAIYNCLWNFGALRKSHLGGARRPIDRRLLGSSCLLDRMGNCIHSE